MTYAEHDTQLSHLVCYHRAPASIPAFLAVVFLPPVVLSYVLPSSSPIIGFFQHLVIYWISLSTSIAVYRLSPFHPLAKIPGPALAKVSRFWAARHVIAGRQHVLSHELFEKYHSDIVRTGPNHVIIRDARAVPILLGGRDRWLKHARRFPFPTSVILLILIDLPENTGYSVFEQPRAEPIVTITDSTEYSVRRRVWERAFTPTAIKSYDPFLNNRIDELMTQLSARVGQPVDIAEWIGYLTIDFMGDFAYGGAFNLLRDGKDEHGYHGVMEGFNSMVELLGTLPWVKPIALRLPQNNGAKRMINLGDKVIQKRIGGGSQIRDLFYHLVRSQFH
jgi:hypothetical protein